MATAFLSHPSFRNHEVPAGHPECSQRLSVIDDYLRAAQVYDLLQHHAAPRASREQIARAHTTRLIAALEHISPAAGYVAIDADTYIGVHSLEAAWRAAGAAVMATDLVIGGQADNAFCAVRPPGHHAERDTAMGFCLFNNIAVGACHALEQHGLRRIAILDFDVHHGNGTGDIFADDERVLFCSTFQYPFYPMRGANSDAANIVNVPLAAGTRGGAYRAAVTEHWLPALEAFRPEMIFVSAGFDGHAEDMLAGLLLVDGDYRWITQQIMQIAARDAGGRIVSCLEGGYALDALGRCVCAHVSQLAGLD